MDSLQIIKFCTVVDFFRVNKLYFTNKSSVGERLIGFKTSANQFAV